MDFTDDTFLGGRVRVRQRARGFRSGLDAVMLAAAVPAESGDSVLELGAGAGVASLCLAARIAGCKIVGAEIDPVLVALAGENAQANGVASRVKFVEADAKELPSSLRTEFDHVFCNPPFHGDDGERSPDAARARATHDASLAGWLNIGISRTRSNGTFTAIVRADRLAEALHLTADAKGVTILPLWPQAEAQAKRALLRWQKGSGAPLRLLPGIALHENSGAYTSAADAILRKGAPLVIAGPRL